MTEAPRPTPRQKAASPTALTTPSWNRKRVVEILARNLIGFGGITIILSILAILIFLGWEVFPLIRGSRVTSLPTMRLPVSDPLYVGIEEYQRIAYAVGPEGRVVFLDTKQAAVVREEDVPGLGRAEVTAVEGDTRGERLALATSDGRVIPVRIAIGSTYWEGDRSFAPSLKAEAPIRVDAKGEALVAVTRRVAEEGSAILAITISGRLVFQAETIESSLLSEIRLGGEEEETRRVHLLDLTDRLPARPMAVALDESLQSAYVGTENGRLLHLDVSDPARPRMTQKVRVGTAAVTVLRFLTGGRTLVAGDAGGGLSGWFRLADPAAGGGRRLVRAHRYVAHEGAIRAVVPSSRDKGFLSVDAKGGIRVQHSTTERLLNTLPGEGHPLQVAMAPRANGIVSLDNSGTLKQWALHNPHPDVSFKALFGKLWYEGYPGPAYVWQSTGGTDDFEPKFSLVPLLFGTMKGTFYALLFAIPVAVLAAVYTSQFMHPSVKSFVKPTVEIMAALPSVVLGFLAGLWMAPLLEKVAPGVLLMAIVIPVFAILSALLWRRLPPGVRGRFRPGVEGLMLIPILIAGMVLCLWLSHVVEAVFFGGNFRDWLYAVLGLQYDQRNALIVGIAMGFAVIPIIFTLSEDALSNVPGHLISGSLALGATPWQTVVRVVLLTASPGIFAAVMVGFGRAVGETMIVLMATGNTPVMDWNIFNGFRTLSANIAVEIPEAPQGGTLYRVLFLAALLLFAMTFAINTVAETVRQRMRKRYSRL